MRTRVELDGKWYETDLSSPIDLSIPVGPENGPLAWYVARMNIEPVRTERFTGSVKEGGAVNFRDIGFNPHGNCTHTECVGHIDEEVTSIGSLLKQFFFKASVITVAPTNPDESGEWVGEDDRVITRSLLEEAFDDKTPGPAVVIRTLPNDPNRKMIDYSNTNPPYFMPDAMEFLLEKGVVHLLTDLPSVDREEDGGLLLSHHVFWEHPQNTNRFRTITEMIFVPDDTPDGDYLLELQTVPFVNDAAPSRPLLYKLALV